MSEKYISASKLKAHYSWLGKDATLSPKDVDDIVDAQPAADVEPVVRCKDCKWYETGVCDFLGAVTLDDDYCSIGVRTERSGSGE